MSECRPCNVTKGHQRSTMAFVEILLVGNETPDQDLTFEKSQRSTNVTNGQQWHLWKLLYWTRI
jgi:hypothetical protein